MVDNLTNSQHKPLLWNNQQTMGNTL